MLQKNDGITLRQMLLIGFVSAFTPIIRTMPAHTLQIAGNAAWLAPIIATPVLFLLVWLMFAFFKKSGGGEHFYDIICKATGNVAGKIICSIFVLWLMYYHSFMLRKSSEQHLSSVYEEGNLVVLILIVAIITMIGAYGKIKSLARSAGIISIIVTATLIISLGFAFANVNTENLLPISTKDAIPVLRASVPVIEIISPFVYLSFIGGYVEGKMKKKTVYICLIMVMLLVTMLMVTTIGALGAPMTERVQNPFFVMVRDVKIFNVLKRIEAAVVAVGVAVEFIFLSISLVVISQIITFITGTGERKKFVIPLAVITAIGALIISPNAFLLSYTHENIINMVNPLLIFILTPVIFIIGKMRRKI